MIGDENIISTYGGPVMLATGVDVDALWTEVVTQQKREKKTNEEKNTHVKKTYERKEQDEDEPRTKSLTSLDLVNSWIDSEHDTFIFNCKDKLLKMALKSLKNNDYNDISQVYDFCEYLSEKSQGFFRKIVYHEDTTQNKMAVLYDWNCGIMNDDGERSHVYIAAVDTINSSWIQSRLETYDSIYNNNLDNEGKLTKKGYSILRRYSQQDMIISFMKLYFFVSYEMAKTFIISSVSGRVNFISKKTEEESI